MSFRLSSGIWNTPFKSSSCLLFGDTAALLGSSRILALPGVSRDGEGIYIHRYGLSRNLGAVLASGVVDAFYHGGHDYTGGSHCLLASTACRGLITGNSNSKRGSGNGWHCSSSFPPECGPSVVGSLYLQQGPAEDELVGLRAGLLVYPWAVY